jgi:hypothetical protein
MSRIIFGLLGMAFAYVLIRYREQIGDMIGDADWMQKVGGVYNFVIIASVFVFFWSVAYLTGTEQIFFAPFKWLIPGLVERQANPLL